MADSSADEVLSSDEDFFQKRCYMCTFPARKTTVVKCNSKTWARFVEFVLQWQHLEGGQAEIAKDFAHKHAAEFERHGDSIVSTMSIPSDAGFHRICYSRFTDKQHILRVSQRMTKSREMLASTSASTEERPVKKKRVLRSSMELKGKSRSEHVLPEICVICQREQYFVEAHTRKRKKERLATCSTIEAKNLQQAAKDSNNTALLLQIDSQDCVAIEVKYHPRCYREYTRYLTKHTSTPTEKGDHRYSEAYLAFCATVKLLIIDQKEIYRLTRLTRMFIDQIKISHGIDATTYKTGNLKIRLQKTFPQLCFHSPRMRCQGDLVFVNDIATETLLVEKKVSKEAIHDDTTSVDSSTTDEKMTDNEEPLASTPPPDHQDNSNLKDGFMSALMIRNAIAAVQSKMPWPPTAEHLTTKTAEEMTPPCLFNFLAWIVGASDNPVTDAFVKVPDGIHKKILSLAQDIVYLQAKGKKQTPKHMSLAMAVRHLTGSAQLIGLLNGFGHCVSHSVILNLDTAIAKRELSHGEGALPSTILPGKHTTLVWDNNDFGEETPTGHGTTHNTNGIVIQRPSSYDKDSPSNVPKAKVKRTRERSMQPPPPNLATYLGVKKSGPPSFATTGISLELSVYAPLLRSPKKKDLAYHLTRWTTEEPLIPSWTGYNQLLSSVEVPPKSVIGYLPVIDASPTEMSTVLTILQRSVEIADKLDLETLVIVMDQAIYSKAQLIRWRNAVFMKRLVIRLGAFHTSMSFIGCIGKRFRDGGLEDILIESEVVATGSVNGVMSGKHYNRSVRAHKLMMEAMQQMRLDAYLQSITDEEAKRTRDFMKTMAADFPTPDYNKHMDSDKFHQLTSSYQQFIEAGNKKETFRYWSTYIDMVQILLLFLRSIREANWNLHLASVRAMLPWIFAYDHLNYARYLPVYWLEMANVATTHPAIYTSFMEGDFTSQRSQHAFAQTACDQTIEQTANRDSKTKGGMVGITTSKGTVNRWIWAHHARGAITRECEAMANRGEHSSTHNDLLSSHKKRDKQDVQKIVDTTNNMANPFEYEGAELMQITSGLVANIDVQHDVSTAYDRGDAEVIQLCKTRLQTDEVDLFCPIKKMKLKTFTSMAKSLKRKIRGKEVILQADRNLLARLVVIGRYRNINLQELLSFSLGPLPLSLATAQGCLVKTNKANLLHALESQPEEKPVVDIPAGSVYIMDGMALIQQVKVTKLPGQPTFRNLALIILKRIVNRAKAVNSGTIHFVTDTYPKVSIKNAERAKRAAAADGVDRVTRVYGQQLPLHQWKKFLSNGESKESLIEYLFETWSNVNSSELKGVQVFLAHGEKCHSFSPRPAADQIVEVAEVPSLHSTQEEADTRLFLHAAHAALTDMKVVIVSPDTDVLIIGLALQPRINAHLYLHTGRGTNLRTIDLKAIHESIGADVSNALIGLHCFTGCDSISAFKGKGKKKALKMLLKNSQLCNPFKDLGERFDADPDMMASLETFVCKLYGQKNAIEVNEARYNMFRLSRKSEIAMPPNHDSLEQHIKRANYQAGIWKRSLQSTPEIPLPSHHGWKMENGNLFINWMTLPPAPDSVMELANCSGSCTKNKCSDTNTCTCLQNNVPCTDLCKCARENCNNITGHDHVDDEDEDELSDPEED